MRQHIQSYRDELGTVDSVMRSVMALLVSIAGFSSVFALGGIAATAIWAWNGVHSWWLMALPTTICVGCAWLFCKFQLWIETEGAARTAAYHLTTMLAPWTKHQYKRAEIVRTLSEDANAYFVEITAGGRTPLEFQLTALHRLANVLTITDELWLGETGECSAPLSAVRLEEHPKMIIPK